MNTTTFIAVVVLFTGLLVLGGEYTVQKSEIRAMEQQLKEKDKLIKFLQRSSQRYFKRASDYECIMDRFKSSREAKNKYIAKIN